MPPLCHHFCVSRLHSIASTVRLTQSLARPHSLTRSPAHSLTQSLTHSYPGQYRREIKWIQWWIHGGSLVDPTIKSVDPTFSGATKRGKSGGSIETTFPLYNFKRENRKETRFFRLPSPRSPLRFPSQAARILQRRSFPGL